MYAMYSSDRVVAQRCACALAHMASIPDLGAAFVERKGLDILVDMLTDSKSRDTRDALQREAASASPAHVREAGLTTTNVAMGLASTLAEVEFRWCILLWRAQLGHSSLTGTALSSTVLEVDGLVY